MNIIKPARLKVGDTIGILATSGAVSDDTRAIMTAVDYFANKGYRVTKI